MKLTILPSGVHTFSRPFTEVRAVELTSKCNLRCQYCPIGAKTMLRPMMDMTEDTFTSVLAWVRHFVKQGTQGELNLAGIGESTLHPQLIPWAVRAREVIGPDRMLFFTTNGLAFTEAMAIELQKIDCKVGVSAHRPEKATAAALLAKKYGLLHGVSNDPMLASINWAGQVDWPVQVSRAEFSCDWLRKGMAFVMADGNVSHCCLDASGVGVVGSVKLLHSYTSRTAGEIRAFEAPEATQPSKLCRGCHHRIALVPGLVQELVGREGDVLP